MYNSNFERFKLIKKASRGWESQKEMEFWVSPSQIEGVLPSDLNGTFLRNGPGVNEVYGTPLIHPIDGDGMICALTFIDGKVHFRSRFVDTKPRQDERRAEKMLYRGQMGSNPRSIFSDIKDFIDGKPPQFRMPANTNSFYWGNKIVACYETGLPHLLDPLTLRTLGPDTFNGLLKFKTFAAHFRYDATIDRLVCMSHRPGLFKPASVGMYEFDRQWNCTHKSPFVKVNKQLLMKVGLGWTSPGQDLQYQSDLPSQIILLRRDGKAEPLLFDTNPCHIYHFGNVYENEVTGEITFNAVCLPPGMKMDFQYKIWLSNVDVSPGRVFEFTLNIHTGKVVRTLADSCSCEFPSVHPYRNVQSCNNKPSRYLYLMANDQGQNLPYIDVVKYDTEKKERQTWCSNGVIGEPVFVPRTGFASANNESDEDDGYVLVQKYNVDEHRSDFIVLDAKRINDGPICRIRMPFHLPYGFHGTFTPDAFLHPPSKI